VVVGSGLIGSSIACQMAKAGNGTPMVAAGLESMSIWTPLVGEIRAVMVLGRALEAMPVAGRIR
jgi:hypothetical protein